MDSETKRLLEENLALSRETNTLLKKVVSAQRWARALRIFYVALIIAGSVGVYYYIQPFIQPFIGNYQSIVSGIEKIQKTTESLPGSSALNSLLDSIKQGR